MRIVKIVSIVGLLAAASVGIVAFIERQIEEDRRFPARIAQEADETQFKWVAASELVTRFGFLDQSLLPPEFRYAHQDLEALFLDSLSAFNEGAEPPPCLPITFTAGLLPTSFPGFPRSVQDITADAAAVVAGTVVAAEGGFSHGRGGMMLEVRVDEWLLDTSPYAKRDTMFSFYAAGEFSVGHARICAATHGLPPAPSIGDKVFLFPYKFSVDPDAEFLDFGQYGAYEAGGRVQASNRLSGVPELESGARWDLLEARMRQVAERRERR